MGNENEIKVKRRRERRRGRVEEVVEEEVLPSPSLFPPPSPSLFVTTRYTHYISLTLFFYKVSD